MANKPVPPRFTTMLFSEYTCILLGIRSLVYVFPATNELSVWIAGPMFQSILVDPIYTLHHLREAAAIRDLFSDKFADAYTGNKVHLPPLLLAALEAVYNSSSTRGEILLWLLVLLVDLRVAMNLFTLARRHLHQEYVEDRSEEEVMESMDERIRPTFGGSVFPIFHQQQGQQQDSLLRLEDIPLLVSQLYFTFATLSNTHSFQNLPLFFLTEALATSSNTIVLSSVYLAVAAYLDIHFTIFLIPLVLLQQQQLKQKDQTKGITSSAWATVGMTAVSMLFLQLLSYLLVADRYLEVVVATHFHSFSMDGLRPSLSILWYFGMEVFRRFRLYFTLLLGGLPYFIVAPATIRLHKYPTVLLAIFWFLAIFYRPPLTLYRIATGFCFLLMNPRSLARMKPFALIATFALPIPITLYVVTLWLWLEPGNGEANFCFFQCLAANIFLAAIFMNFCSASLRRDKAIRVTEKAILQQTDN